MKCATAPLLLAVVGCATLHASEQHNPRPATWEEYCLQSEAICLSQSRSGMTINLGWFPAVITTKNVDPTQLLRFCQVQGEICRIRHIAKPGQLSPIGGNQQTDGAAAPEPEVSPTSQRRPLRPGSRGGAEMSEQEWTETCKAWPNH